MILLFFPSQFGTQCKGSSRVQKEYENTVQSDRGGGRRYQLRRDFAGVIARASGVIARASGLVFRIRI